MRELVFKKQFKKDVERIKRTGRDMSRLREVIALLADGTPLPAINRDHQLVGNFQDYRECHLGGDWLLTYQIRDAMKEGQASVSPGKRALAGFR